MQIKLLLVFTLPTFSREHLGVCGPNRTNHRNTDIHHIRIHPILRNRDHSHRSPNHHIPTIGPKIMQVISCTFLTYLSYYAISYFGYSGTQYEQQREDDKSFLHFELRHSALAVSVGTPVNALLHKQKLAEFIYPRNPCQI